jgi:hypothetical protein
LGVMLGSPGILSQFICILGTISRENFLPFVDSIVFLIIGEPQDWDPGLGDRLPSSLGLADGSDSRRIVWTGTLSSDSTALNDALFFRGVFIALFS